MWPCAAVRLDLFLLLFNSLLSLSLSLDKNRKRKFALLLLFTTINFISWRISAYAFDACGVVAGSLNVQMMPMWVGTVVLSSYKRQHSSTADAAHFFLFFFFTSIKVPNVRVRICPTQIIMTLSLFWVESQTRFSPCSGFFFSSASCFFMN